MEINLKFDEAEIIKDCLKGLSKENIKEKIIQQVINLSVSKISSTIYKKAPTVLSKTEISRAIQEISDESKKILKEDFKKYLKSNFREYTMEEMVDQYLTSMIEEHFEYSPVSIEFKVGKTKNVVGVLDTKSNKKK